jgi:hypothetical protein
MHMYLCAVLYFVSVFFLAFARLSVARERTREPNGQLARRPPSPVMTLASVLVVDQ